jgi:hypothetical protein
VGGPELWPWGIRRDPSPRRKEREVKEAASRKRRDTAKMRGKRFFTHQQEEKLASLPEGERAPTPFSG